ncbi:LexA family transcriptional regulator [Pontibacter sp. SGAir0037]|uniref:LexA family transcriptional regulator n=1 Tax=Pontibacter sp. SGAir0037 TaxID=2571030 RepID=UPI0010CD0697|nr:LexA family transcriptional regulator [Pontibacter sp. SGAir0037]QCR21459.1 hypothetical protein C1N53_03245 [Pontibacter sp. SGAir0037]
MSYIGKNIKKIRTVKKLSQAAFAELFNLARPSVGAYEEGRSEPKIDTLLQISQYFGLSLDQLLAKELTVNELYGFDIFKRNYTAGDVLLKVATAPASPLITAVFVSSAQYEAYVQHHAEAAYLQSLPQIAVPATSAANSLSRAFEMRTADMLQQQQGIHIGDILYASPVAPDQARGLAPGEVVVIVTEASVVVRRFIKAEKETLLLKADNPSFKQEQVLLRHVKELWRVAGIYSTSLSAPAPLENRVAALEALVHEMQDKLNRIGS